MKGLIACECSGIVRDAFIAQGHDVISCDLKETQRRGKHYKGSVFDIINEGFDFMIAHPPCTYLAVTANKWLKDQPERKSGALVGGARRQARIEAINFFMALAKAPIPIICIENPVGCMSSLWREPDQIIQPMEFGHAEPKKTCLWLKGLPLLKGTSMIKPGHSKIQPEYHTTVSGKRLPKWYAYADRSQGQEMRAEIRSQTFQGIADAMAAQWCNENTISQQSLFL